MAARPPARRRFAIRQGLSSDPTEITKLRSGNFLHALPLPLNLCLRSVVIFVTFYFSSMPTRDEIFDDANADLAIGELESAVAKYQRCVDVDPAFFDGWHALGMALMKIGRFNEAIEAGKKAVELKPNDQIGWTSLSLFYNRAGNIKEVESAGAKAKILSLGGKIAQE